MCCVSLVFAIKSAKELKGHKGRLKFTLLSQLKKDIEVKGLKLDTINDLYILRSLAKDKLFWKNMID